MRMLEIGAGWDEERMDIVLPRIIAKYSLP